MGGLFWIRIGLHISFLRPDRHRYRLAGGLEGISVTRKGVNATTHSNRVLARGELQSVSFVRPALVQCQWKGFVDATWGQRRRLVLCSQLPVPLAIDFQFKRLIGPAKN